MNFLEDTRMIQTKIGAQQDLPFVRSLKRTTNKISKTVKIILLQFLTLSCPVVRKLQICLSVYGVLVPPEVKMCQKGAKVCIKIKVKISQKYGHFGLF